MKYHHIALVAGLVYFRMFTCLVYGADPKPWTHLNFQNDPELFQFAIVPDRTVVIIAAPLLMHWKR